MFGRENAPRNVPYKSMYANPMSPNKMEPINDVNCNEIIGYANQKILDLSGALNGFTNLIVSFDFIIVESTGSLYNFGIGRLPNAMSVVGGG